MKKIRIGTRKSSLAMAQTELAAGELLRAAPDLDVEIVPQTSFGDRILDKSLVEFGGKGVFVSEFEEALLDGRIDLAVHSAKDLPAVLADGLEILSVLERGDPRDVLVTVRGRERGRRPMVIGTGSLRRQAQIRERMDADCRPLRGNVNTRLAKLQAGEYDGIILAAAGLKRLGLDRDENFSFEYLPEREFIPAGGQAIIAIEGRADSPLRALLKEISDESAMRSFLAEREVLALLNAGCNEAVGVHSRMEGGRFFMELMKETAGAVERRTAFGVPEEYRRMAEKLTDGLRTEPAGDPGKSFTAPAKAAAACASPGFGMVYLVGAGPGDPGLITVRGARLLSVAEVLVYDHLASADFLRKTPDSCEKLYVGKQAGRHSMKQEEISRLLVEKALAGKLVVRLKGGDPFVFGRGGEEILELERNKIPYEVVPGVTSAVAACAHAGIPVTHRLISRSFHVITGHNAEDGVLDEEALKAYAALPGTLVFLMGLSNIDTIAERLIRYGKSPDTPAAVVTDGTLPRMRCVRAGLSEIAAVSRASGLLSPGVIVVGETAAFHMTCGADRALSGVSVGVTGTDAIFEKLSGRLSSMGAEIVRVSRSRVMPENREELLKLVKRIPEYGWVALTSRNAVSIFFEAIKTAEVDLRALSRTKFAVVGRGTGEHLKSFGFHADYIPDRYTTEALAAGLASRVMRGEAILIPRARQGSKILTETLRAAGLTFTDLSVYDIRTESVLPEASGNVDYVTFESGSGVRGFFEANPDAARELLRRARPVCIGRATEGVLREYGVDHALVARDYTAEGIAEVLLDDRKNRDICL